jgi:fibronectin-binding autotransporter adhesin
MRISTARAGVLSPALSGWAWLFVAAVLTAMSDPAWAASGSWSATTSGNWSDTANWSGGTVADGQDSTATFNQTLSGEVTVDLDSPRTLGNLSFTSGSNQLWRIDDAGNPANVLTLSRSDATAPTITVATSTRAEIATVIDGTGGLGKTGASNTGILILSGANTYSGKTTVSGGSLEINNDNGLGVAPGSFVADQLTIDSGATLRTTAATTMNANRGVTIGVGGGTLSVSGPFRYNGRFTGSGNTLTLGGSDTILANTTGTASDVDWTITSNRLFYNGLNALGSGSVTIQSGATLVSQNAPPATVANPITVQSGGRISARSTATYSNVTMPTTGTIVFNRDDANTTALEVTSGVTLTGDLEVNMSQQGTGAVGDTTLSGVIAGPHRLVKTGTGTAPGRLILSGANTYSGGTTITGGSLRVTSDGNLGAVPGTFDADNIIFNGGTLNAGTFFTVNANRGITVDAAGGQLLGLMAYPGRISGAGNTLTLGDNDKVLTNNTGTASDVNFDVSDGRLFFVNLDALGSGSVAVANNANLVANMPGTPEVTNAVTLASGGRLSARQAGATYTNVTLPTSGTVVLNYDDQATGTVTVTSGVTLAGNLAVDMTQQATGAIGPAVLSGVIGGTGDLSKTGIGQLTLSGANTYAGNTTVSAGTLVAASPTAFASGTVTVDSGATLRLAPGGIVANAIANSGTLAFAGGGIARTSTEALASVMNLVAGTEASPLTNLAPGVAWSAKQAETYSDVLGLTNTNGSIQILSLSYDDSILGGLSETSLFLGWDNGTDWVNAIAGNTGSAGGSAVTDYTGSYAAANVLATAAYLGSWGRDPATNTAWAVIDHNSDFVVIAVPEPSTMLLGVAGLAVAGLAVRRRVAHRPA